MNKYLSTIGKTFRYLFAGPGQEYAVTIGQTTYYSCEAARVSPSWQAHEDCHKQQWARDGKLKFISSYLWQWATKGHSQISYEIEAIQASKLPPNPLR